MTRVRQSVVSVVTFGHFVSHDPADAETMLNLINIDRQRTSLHFKRGRSQNVMSMSET